MSIERISVNTFFNYLGQIWYKLLNLVLLPIIVAGLGKEGYGLYTFVVVIIGYYALLDLGIGSAVVKYISEYNANQKYEEINQLVSTSLKVHFFLGTIGCLLIIFLGRFIVAAVEIPPQLVQTARTIIYISAFQFALNLTTSTFSGILKGLQRIDLLNKISIVLSTLTISSIAILARLGYGLVPIIFLNLLYNLIGIVVTAYFAKRTIPSLKVSLRFRHLPYLKTIVSFGVWSFVGQAGTLIHLTTDRLLIGLFLPMAWVTYYTVAVKLAGIIRSAPMPLVGVFFPAVSDLKARGEESAIREIFLRGTKYVLSLSLPISLVLFTFSREILASWMGAKFVVSSSYVLILFVLGYFLSTLTFINTSVLFGLGLHRLIAIYCVFSSSINLVLDLLLIPRLGINGAAIASVVAFLVTSPALLLHSTSILKIRASELLRAVKQPIVSGLLVALIAYGLRRLFPTTNLLQLILSGTFILACYYGLLMIMGGFDAKDRWVFRKFAETILKSTPLRSVIDSRGVLGGKGRG